MEAALRERLASISEESSAELSKLVMAYADMSESAKLSPFYKSLGEKVASIEAVFNTLVQTAESFK